MYYTKIFQHKVIQKLLSYFTFFLQIVLDLWNLASMFYIYSTFQISH